jgi:hypothetical protein
MPNQESDTPRLLLSHVLEEEYVKLHGGSPPVHPVGASEDAKLRKIYELIHALPRKRSALCFSGGGIRSATFALGLTQGLARCGVLNKFDYLSTVSGGGYIGSWLTAWIHRHGTSHVIDALTRQPQSPVAPEPMPISRLRDYSSYLNPKLGLLSADTWTLLATVLRNLLLNWFVFIPLLAAVLMIPRVCIPVIKLPVSEDVASWCLWIGCISLVWAIGYIGLHRPSTRLLRGDQAGYLKWCLLPLTLAAILLITYWAWAGFKLKWPNAFSFSLFNKTFTVTGDVLAFAGLGVLLNFIGFVAGTILKLLKFRGELWKEIRKSGLGMIWEAIAAILTGALGGLLVWCAATKLFPNPLESDTTVLLYVCFSSPIFLSALLLAESVFVGLSSYSTTDHDREWWSRSGAWILIYVVVWSAASALLIFGLMGLLRLETELQASIASIGGLAGFITIFFGQSPKTGSEPETEKKKQEKDKGGLKAILMKYGLALAAPIFAIFLVLLVALGAEILFNRGVPQSLEDYRSRMLATSLVNFSIFVIGLAVGGLLMGIFININKFSLHAMYRNRLIRAYLGASREKRKPNLFTGFDDNDNIQMHALWPNGKPPHEEPARQPFHVINMALNLVAGEKLAWQQRKAESFTVTPLHAGSYCSNVGYRRIEYEVDDDRIYYGGKEGISLGTAVAISGAAASPNMGYHSSPVVGFLMTLFNARLGWWLGNPGPPGRHTFKFSGPLLASRPLIAEALGLTDDQNKYVYLSDGGHFENLGLYEMVLRRCHIIVVSDAGQDGDFKFEDLGGAIRKIRIDFGIPIDFNDGVNIYSRNQNKMGYYCAIGTIGYSCLDGDGTDGILLYIKPTLYGEEPRDVYQYAQSNPAFPHDPTSDQWFEESQFESYRMLGSYIAKVISGYDKEQAKGKGSIYAGKDAGLDQFMKKVYEYLKLPAPGWLDDRITPASPRTGP